MRVQHPKTLILQYFSDIFNKRLIGFPDEKNVLKCTFIKIKYTRLRNRFEIDLASF